MFAHHDVEFNGTESMEALLHFCKTVGFGILGTCGVADGQLHYSDRNVIRNNDDLLLRMPIKADIVDEPVFVVRKRVVTQYPFNDQLITGFHLCAAEYSLRMKTIGLPIYLFPLNFYRGFPKTIRYSTMSFLNIVKSANHA